MEKDQSSQVEIRVDGHLDQAWTEWLDGLHITYTGRETLLVDRVKDQAALYGLIAKLAISAQTWFLSTGAKPARMVRVERRGPLHPAPLAEQVLRILFG